MPQNEHSLPILGQEEEPADPWGLPKPTPTTLLGLFDFPSTPDFESVKSGLIAAFGDRLVIGHRHVRRSGH